MTALRLLILAVLLGLGVVVSLSVGARAVTWPEVLRAIAAPDPTLTDHAVVRDLRLPRTLAALMAGLALGVSGVVMQALTRNPLADPGLLGVNAGAALAVVVAAWMWDVSDPARQIWFALPGAAVIATLAYALGTLGRGNASPVRLALAGAALSALLLSLVSSIILTHQDSLETYRFWIVGSVAGVRPDALATLAPVIGAGIVLAALAARPLSTALLGDEAALALGMRLGRLRALALAAVTLSCGGAVALCGPIGFVGLVIPHAARALMGADMLRTMAAAALLGPLFLIAGDIAGRLAPGAGELPVGIAAALIGGPALVVLARRMEPCR